MKHPHFNRISFKFSALSLVRWRLVGTDFYSGYMVINSKGEKGCESPFCLWVTRWLLIFFGSCDIEWVASSLCRSFWCLPFSILGYVAFDWLVNIGEGVCFWNGIYQVVGSKGRWTSFINLVICNTENEELILKNKANIAQLAIADCWSFQKFSPAQRFKRIDT